MAAFAFSRLVMFTVRALPKPLHRMLDAWAQRQAQERRERRLRQYGR